MLPICNTMLPICNRSIPIVLHSRNWYKDGTELCSHMNTTFACVQSDHYSLTNVRPHASLPSDVSQTGAAGNKNELLLIASHAS